MRIVVNTNDFEEPPKLNETFKVISVKMDWRGYQITLEKEEGKQDEH